VLQSRQLTDLAPARRETRAPEIHQVRVLPDEQDVVAVQVAVPEPRREGASEETRDGVDLGPCHLPGIRQRPGAPDPSEDEEVHRVVRVAEHGRHGDPPIGELAEDPSLTRALAAAQRP